MQTVTCTESHKVVEVHTVITVLASMPVLFDTSLTISIFVMSSKIYGCKDVVRPKP